MAGELAAEEITPPLDAAVAACQEELDRKQAQVAGFLAVRLTVSGEDGAVSDLEARFAPCHTVLGVSSSVLAYDALPMIPCTLESL